MKVSKTLKFLTCGILAISVSLSLASCSTSQTKSEVSSQAPATSEEVSTKPYTRMDDKIDADKMDRLCKPVITGDFIQPWYCKDWDQARWEEHFDTLKEAGIDTVIFQGSSHIKDGKFSYLYFETDMAKNKNLSNDNLVYSPDTLGDLLAAAKAYNFKVYIGLSFDDDWWDTAKVKDSSVYKRWSELELKSAQEIYKKYYSEYKEQIEGFYWVWEMYTNADGLESYWSDQFNITLDGLTALDKNIPIMMCPYISAYFDITPEQHLKMWQNFYAKTHMRQGDIMCPQDNFGTSEKPLGYVERHIKAMKQATKEDGRCKFWLDVENFDNSGDEGKSASIDRFTRQLDISSKYADRLICFSYAHYYNPANNQDEYHDAYVKYIKSLS